MSQSLARQCKWEVLDQTTIGSDHYPIRCIVGIEVEQNVKQKIPRWKFKTADWEKFKEVSEAKLLGMVNDKQEPEELNNTINEIICCAAEEVIGKRLGERKGKSVPWWTEKCSEVISIRNKAFKKVKKTYSFQDVIVYKRSQAVVRKVIRSAKRDYWRQFCDEIGERVDISELWGMIRKMGGNKIDRNIPVIIDEDKYIMIESEKAEVLAKAFVKIHSNCNIRGYEKEKRASNKR